MLGFGASSADAYDPVLQLATDLASALGPWLSIQIVVKTVDVNQTVKSNGALCKQRRTQYKAFWYTASQQGSGLATHLASALGPWLQIRNLI